MLRLVNLLFRRTVRVRPLTTGRKFLYNAHNQNMILRFYNRDIDDEDPMYDEDKDEEVGVPTDEKAAPEGAEGDKENPENGTRSIPLLGGGLEKLQGGLMEENYFSTQNKEIIRKLHENGQKLNAQPTPQQVEEEESEEWKEYEKSRKATKWSDSSSLSRQKNPIEEKYFLDEQLDSIKILSDKIREEGQQPGQEKPEGGDNVGSEIFEKQSDQTEFRDEPLPKDPDQKPVSGKEPEKAFYTDNSDVITTPYTIETGPDYLHDLRKIKSQPDNPFRKQQPSTEEDSTDNDKFPPPKTDA